MSKSTERENMKKVYIIWELTKEEGKKAERRIVDIYSNYDTVYKMIKEYNDNIDNAIYYMETYEVIG